MAVPTPQAGRRLTVRYERDGTEADRQGHLGHGFLSRACPTIRRRHTSARACSIIGPFEIVVLVVVGLIVFGPDKLPGLAKDAGRMLRTLRDLAQGARTQLRDELGPEFGDLDLRSLNPRTAIQQAMFDDDDDQPPSARRRKPPRPDRRRSRPAAAFARDAL